MGSSEGPSPQARRGRRHPSHRRPRGDPPSPNPPAGRRGGRCRDQRPPPHPHQCPRRAYQRPQGAAPPTRHRRRPGSHGGRPRQPADGGGGSGGYVLAPPGGPPPPLRPPHLAVGATTTAAVGCRPPRGVAPPPLPLPRRPRRRQPQRSHAVGAEGGGRGVSAAMAGRSVGWGQLPCGRRRAASGPGRCRRGRRWGWREGRRQRRAAARPTGGPSQRGVTRKTGALRGGGRSQPQTGGIKEGGGEGKDSSRGHGAAPAGYACGAERGDRGMTLEGHGEDNGRHEGNTHTPRGWSVR